jgi:hypothetical protein
MAINPSLQVSDGLARRPFDVFGLRLLVQNLDTRTDRNFVIELWINALHFILAFSNKSSKFCYSVWPTCLVPQIRDPRFVASGPTSQSHRKWSFLKMYAVSVCDRFMNALDLFIAEDQSFDLRRENNTWDHGGRG